MSSPIHTGQPNPKTAAARRRFRPDWRIAWTICFLFSLFIRFSSFEVAEAAEPPKVRYEKALQLARSGRHDAALPILRELVEEFPKERFYLYDYMAVLGWAGRDPEVLALRPRVDLAIAPPYLLETLGRSSRNVRDYPGAIHFFQIATERAPERVEGWIGLALSHSDAGETPKALEILQRLEKEHPERIDVLRALALADQRGGKPFEALAVYQRILRLDPSDRESRRQRIFITRELGASHLAASMARENRELFTDPEFEAIAGDEAAQSIRWGGLYNPSPQTRFQEIDAGIRLLEEQVKRLKEREPLDTAAYRRARYDLMPALRDRQRMPEVIALHEALAAENAPIPDYALAAAADAYRQEGKPGTARRLYSELLTRNPGDFDTRLSLFYLDFDDGEYVSALKEIDRLAAEQRDPSRKLQAESAAIKGRAWVGQLGEGERRLTPLVDRAPNNSSLHADLGYIYLWRGWPRLAKDEFQLSRAIDPEALDPQLGEAAAQWELFEFRQAAESRAALEARYPGNNQVARLQREEERFHLRELRVEVSGRWNSGAAVGSRDLTLDVTLYSSPIATHYRLFDHAHYDSARFPEGTGLFRRLGAGLEYRARDVRIVGELTTGYRREAGVGLSLRADWMPDDFWMLGAHLDTQSNGVPLRGRLNEQIDGWGAGLNADYRFHESRSIGVGWERLGFSDGNRRTVWSAVVVQGFIHRPKYKLDGRLGFYGSNNSREEASYYNPKSDLSSEITLINEWLVFRRGPRSFIHRLGLMAGTYSESGFGSKGIWGIYYEHEWNLSDRLYLLYGIGRARPVYDGAAENSLRYYLTLDWRF
jgi:biofilm PGA synthesis protein PgaA